MFDNLRADLNRYGSTRSSKAMAVLSAPGLWATAVYRFRRWVRTRNEPAPIRLALETIGAAMQIGTVVCTKTEIPASASIGPGLQIVHTGSVVIGSNSCIGTNCTIGHGVTIGHRGGPSQDHRSVSTIGDRVYIGPGAAILGAVTVGDDALVGVGAIVTRDIPMRGVATGNPAVVRSHKGSFDLITYPGMAEDPNRITSLARRALTG